MIRVKQSETFNVHKTVSNKVKHLLCKKIVLKQNVIVTDNQYSLIDRTPYIILWKKNASVA